MTVKELIVQLLNYDPNAEIHLSDDIGFVDEYNNEVDGSIYEIEKLQGTSSGRYVDLIFHNRNHFKLKNPNP